ncbi:hypothetical protein GE09DRAFT_1124778 [Coniochaeta sp. 2T2.1]|nr:hypothetical protein GE09DRAFT_1124778 [Coniochaeta sp. 2T2.1]
MVKIAIAGGSGQVAREVIDALEASDNHEITILTRRPLSSDAVNPGIRDQVVDYNDKDDLVKALQGIHTVLSFIQLLSDPGQKSQKSLIDACVLAGVKRFAPSEYGSAGTVDMPWWAGKEEVRRCLRELNENGKVLEYTFFQPGLLLDYLASPHRTAKHVAPLDTVFDFQNRRAIVVEGHEGAIMAFTSVRDLSKAIALAVDYSGGEWPEVSGIRGNRVSVSRVIEIGEKVRGSPFAIEKVKLEDLEAGILKTSWIVGKKHHAVSDEDALALFKTVTIGMLLSSVKGAWDVSDDVNKLFPELCFEEIETFLNKVWSRKP